MFPSFSSFLTPFCSSHDDFEKEVGRIAAENGFSFILDPDGTVKVRLKNNQTVQLPALDGKIENVTQEIMGLRGKANVSKVADGIEHSYKKFKDGSGRTIQADVAITYTPKGSPYHRQDIEAGVQEHLRRLSAGNTDANPRIYLHIDLGTRTIYYRNVRPKQT